MIKHDEILVLLEKKKFLLRLLNWNEKISSKIVEICCFLFEFWWLAAAIVNLIDLAILSNSVVKNSDASSWVPTPNTFEISLKI